MRTFRCKQCKTKKPTDGEIITHGIKRFCSKSCRRSFVAEENKKAKEKEKQKRKNKRESISMLTKKLDKIFSKFIRQRDADSEGMITCITCQTKIPWQESHNCHFISRGCKLYRWDEENCNAGCPGCNTFNQERHQRIYTFKQIERLGVEKVQTMLREEKNIHRVNKGLLKEKIEYYTNKLKDYGI